MVWWKHLTILFIDFFSSEVVCIEQLNKAGLNRFLLQITTAENIECKYMCPVARIETAPLGSGSCFVLGTIYKGESIYNEGLYIPCCKQFNINFELLKFPSSIILLYRKTKIDVVAMATFI
jgi:hypothetical protein